MPSVNKCKDQHQGDHRDSQVFDRFFKIRQVPKYHEQEKRKSKNQSGILKHGIYIPGVEKTDEDGESMKGSLLFTSGNGLNGEEPGWSAITDSLLLDSAGISGSPAYLMSVGQEFSPTFSMPLQELVNQKNDMIDVSVRIRNMDSLNQSLLVLGINGKHGLVEWTASHFHDHDPGKGEWYRVHHTYRTTQNPRRKNLQVNVYIWNKDKINFLSDEFIVRSRGGNPVLYGLMEKF